MGSSRGFWLSGGCNFVTLRFLAFFLLSNYLYTPTCNSP